MASTHRDLDAAIAATRFGLGAKPGEIATAAGDPRGYLKAQIRRDGADTFSMDGESGRQRLAEFRDYRREKQEQRRQNQLAGVAANDEDLGAVKIAGQAIRQAAVGDIGARLALATDTDAGFRERWALFWANHFTVATSKGEIGTLAGPYENEALRPHVFGRFVDLLAAAETHPAMLLYLDQAQSVGPDSRAAMFVRTGGAARKGPGLNENLAREILELHTVGVNGGYRQADVTEFACALTGLSVGGPRDPTNEDAVIFRENAHEPGARTVMGVSYREGGKEQAARILADLAAKPETARFVCSKIARHFVADDPPPALVVRLEKTWMATGGDLGRVAETLVDAPEAWTPAALKLKTPYEFVVSSYRALGQAPRNPQQAVGVLTGLGQRPFSAPSPKGWPDEAQPWAASDAIVKRMQFAQGLGAQAGPTIQDPNAFAAGALGARLTPAVATAVSRAESRPEAVALLLMSPEFQRR